MDVTRKTVSVPEAAEILGISASAAYEAARLGDLPALRIRGRIVVPIAALDRLLAEAGERPAA